MTVTGTVAAFTIDDLSALADRVIAERQMEADLITTPRGVLDFGPGMISDTAAIEKAIKDLTPAQREDIARIGRMYGSSAFQAALRAIGFAPISADPLNMMVSAAAAVLALAIARKLLDDTTYRRAIASPI